MSAYQENKSKPQLFIAFKKGQITRIFLCEYYLNYILVKAITQWKCENFDEGLIFCSSDGVKLLILRMVMVFHTTQTKSQ